MDTDKYIILVMEYAECGTLVEMMIAHGRLNENCVRKFFREIIRAIAYCHSMYVVHRDIKLENILLDSQFRIKIIDFGLSTLFVPGLFLNTFCGSPTYAAPELIQKQPYEGPEIDIWSLGVVLYVLVTKELPFDGKNFHELFINITKGEYIIPPYLSDDCKDLISKLLIVNPKERLTLKEISTHKWTTPNGSDPIPIPENVSNQPSIDIIDKSILEIMEVELGYPQEDTIRALESGAYNDAAATYNLLVVRKNRKMNLKTSEEPPPTRNN